MGFVAHILISILYQFHVPSTGWLSNFNNMSLACRPRMFRLGTRCLPQQWNILNRVAKFEKASSKLFSLLSVGAVKNSTQTCVHTENRFILSGRQSLRSIITEQSESKSFPQLLRESNFVGIGDYVGRQCSGTVVEATDSNLFVDYGGKFLCVCKIPRKSSKSKWVGTRVEIKILAWELSAKFIGATKDITLLESEGVITKVY